MGHPGRIEADRTVQGTQSTADYVAQGAHETVDRIASQTGSAFDRAESTANDISATAQSKYDDLMNSEWAETVRDEVRARPLAAVGIALAAGLLISRLL
jgi:ElaB/YqjD/DUF883 family membrane-anchored ribosome-binding protein